MTRPGRLGDVHPRLRRTPTGSLRRPGLLLAAPLLALGLLAAGCGGGGGDGGGDAKAAGDRIASARDTLTKADGVTIDLSTPELPRGVQGILKASGTGTKAPAFKGTITVIQSGLSLEVPVIAVDSKVYVQFGGGWRTIDPATFGAPDPATLFASSGGLGQLLTGLTAVKAGEDTRDGKQVLSTIDAEVPGSSVVKVIPSADQAADFDARFTLDDKDVLQKVTVRGPFYSDSDSDVTYTIRFSDYGKSTKITAP